jgi:hypothetical protein
MKYTHTIWGLLLTVGTSFADPPIAITADAINRTSYLIHISNQSTNDIVFIIGTNVGNGRYIFYDALTLIFNTLDGQEMRVESNWDNLAGIAGRLDPVFMALTPGATLAITVDETNWRFGTLQSNHLSTFRASLDTSIGTNIQLPIEYVNGNVLSGAYESCQYKIDPQQSVPAYVAQGAPSAEP